MTDATPAHVPLVPFDSFQSNSLKNTFLVFDESSNQSAEAMDFTNVTPARQISRNDRVEEDSDSFNLTDRLTVDEVEMVADLFYLPFESGNFGVWLIESFNWLRVNAHFINASRLSRTDSEMATKWRSKADDFCNRSKTFHQIIEKLCQTGNRSLLFDLYPYVSDMRCVIGMMASYIKWLSMLKRGFR